MLRSNHQTEQKICGADIRRHRVIDAARKLFVENGFDGTGVSQISKESKVAVAQLYRDFRDKQGIVLSIVDIACRSYLDSKAKELNINDMSIEEAIDWLSEFISFDGIKRNVELFISIIGESVKNDEVLKIFCGAYSQSRDCVLAAINIVAPSDSVIIMRENLADKIMILSLGVLNYHLLNPLLDTDDPLKSLISSIRKDLWDLRAVALLRI